MPSDKENKEAPVCTSSIECESPAVHSYLDLLQSVINRMASNSASCKSWCITLVSALVVILIDKDKAHFIFIAIAPTLLFAFLDSYYLAMEQGFRDKYNAFIKKLHDDAVQKKDLFVITPEATVNRSKIWKSAKSISIRPFYGILTLMIIIVAFIASGILSSWLINLFKCAVKGG